jgi:hypothetical protein
MPSLLVLDVEEFAPVWEHAVSDDEITVTHRGTYVEVSFPNELTVDRKASGLRHALWYSCIGGVLGAEVVQFDKVQLRLVADEAAGG